MLEHFILSKILVCCAFGQRFDNQRNADVLVNLSLPEIDVHNSDEDTLFQQERVQQATLSMG